MPHLETPDELAEVIANKAHVYGACDEFCEAGVKPCRAHFVADFTERIRQSVINEHLLATSGAAKKGGA